MDGIISYASVVVLYIISKGIKFFGFIIQNGSFGFNFDNVDSDDDKKMAIITNTLTEIH